jgi:molybdopterin synthase sulfur carrier subunit
MVRIVVMSPFENEFFGGRDRLDLEASNLFAMVRELDAVAPGFAEIAGVRAQFAIDGVVVPDWSTSLAGASEVIVLPRVGGG